MWAFKDFFSKRVNFPGSGLSGYWYNRDGLQFDKRLSIEPSAKPLSQTLWLAVSHAVLHTLSQTLRLTFFSLDAELVFTCVH